MSAPAHFLTGPQIYERFGISRTTWRRWLASGKAPAPVQGLAGHPRWRVTDIERFEGESGSRFFRSHKRGSQHGDSLREVSHVR